MNSPERVERLPGRRQEPNSALVAGTGVHRGAIHDGAVTGELLEEDRTGGREGRHRATTCG